MLLFANIYISGVRNMPRQIICFIRAVLFPCVLLFFSSVSVYAEKAQEAENKTSIHKKDDNPILEQVVPKIETSKDQTQYVKADADLTSIFSRLMTAFPDCDKEFRTAIKVFLTVSPQSSELVLNVLKSSDENAGKSDIKECHHKSVGDALAGIVADLTETDTRMASDILGLIIKSRNPKLQTAFLSATGNMTAATGKSTRKATRNKSK